MQDNDKILNRLVGILKKLTNKEAPKIKDLAAFFNVTQRTIQRDVYQRLSHFPIEKNKEGALQFLNGFSLDQAVLNNEEMMLTYFALCKMKEDNPHFEKNIHNILKKLVKPKDKILKNHSVTKNNTPNNKCIEKIEEAMLKNKVIHIECTKKPVFIKPYKFCVQDNHQTLIGEDCHDGKIKSIELSTIIDVHIQKKRFKTKRSLEETLNNVHTSFFYAHNAKEYEALIHKDVANHFIQHQLLPDQSITKQHENGDIEVRFISESEHHVSTIIKHWMPHLKITKPLTYNEKLISEMQHYINHCKS